MKLMEIKFTFKIFIFDFISVNIYFISGAISMVLVNYNNPEQ